MKYRLLGEDEWERARPMFEAHGGQMPTPDTSFIAIAEDEHGAIMGLATLQLAWHKEPWIVDEGQRGKVSTKILDGLLDEVLPKGSPCFIFSPNDHITELAGAHGYKETGWKALMKEVQ